MPFKLVVESVSSVSTDMLDLRIHKGERWKRTGKLDCGAFVKKTYTGAPLSHHSYHVPSVHDGWPKSRVNHYRRLATSYQEFAEPASLFFERLSTMCPGHPSLSELRRSILRKPISNHGKPPAPRGGWIVLPYHEVWKRSGIVSVIRATLKEAGFTDLESEKLFAGVAWKNCAPHLSELVCDASEQS